MLPTRHTTKKRRFKHHLAGDVKIFVLISFTCTMNRAESCLAAVGGVFENRLKQRSLCSRDFFFVKLNLDVKFIRHQDIECKYPEVRLLNHCCFGK
jgi:hypothetical protein